MWAVVSLIDPSWVIGSDKSIESISAAGDTIFDFNTDE